MEKDTLESGRAGKSAGRRTTGRQTTASEDGVSRCARAKRAPENNSIETSVRVVDASAAIGDGVGERSEETVAFED
tara:strand:- start:2993 stop:3220 length:228 start_codon:yes stop_codon:yes gene_type:complete